MCYHSAEGEEEQEEEDMTHKKVGFTGAASSLCLPPRWAPRWPTHQTSPPTATGTKTFLSDSIAAPASAGLSLLLSAGRQHDP